MIQRAVILSTGDEITTGKVVDSNSSYLADKLNEIGVDLVAVLTVGDVPERLEWAWRTAMEMGDVVISTGGIGPTADDLTTETIARLTGKSLGATNPRSTRCSGCSRRSAARCPRIISSRRSSPRPPRSSRISLGTAPGFRMAVPQANHTSHLIVLPGVPREMKPMVEEQVIPVDQA